MIYELYNGDADENAMLLHESFAECCAMNFNEFSDNMIMVEDEKIFDDLEAVKTWYSAPSEILGNISPEDFVTQKWPDMTFSDALRIIRPFLTDTMFSFPNEIRALFASFEESIEWSLNMIGEIKERVAALDDSEMFITVFTSFVDLCMTNEDKSVNAALLDLFKCLNDENVEYYDGPFEDIIMTLAAKESALPLLIDYVNNAEDLDYNVFSTVSAIALSENKSDEIYRMLRTCTKRAAIELKTMFYDVFLDYGDARAISFLRTCAQKHLETIRRLDLSEDEKKDDTLAFKKACYVIKELGGNIEDLL